MARRRRLPDLSSSGGFIGMGGLACLLFVFLASAGFLPWWGTTVLVVAWLVLLVVGARWFTPRPARTVLLPVVGLVVYAAVVWLATR